MLKQMFKTVNFGFFFFNKKFQIIFIVVLLKILYCIYYLFILCVLCVHVYTQPHTQVWGLEDNCGELVLFIHYVGSRDLT